MKRLIVAGIVSIGVFMALAVEQISGWRGDFINCTNEAIQSNIPLVMVWGNKFCSHCAELEEDLQRANFTAWKAKQEYIFCFVEGLGINGEDPATAPGAKVFAGTAGGTKEKTPVSYPYVCVYWRKADGSISATRFTTESALTVAKAAATYFAGWTPRRDPDVFSFPVSDAEFDRLEALSTTTYVDVPVVRELVTGGVTTNKIIATWPRSIAPSTTNSVVWSATETQKLVRVSLARGAAAFPVGEEMTLSMFNSEGEASGTLAVHFVDDPPTSVLNPKFVGEAFDYGEWTMDYEAAKNKEGYVLAMFSGVLWCPFCYGMETSLLASEAFTKWAKDNKVSLVLFDQSRASTPATAAGSGLARLLTYNSGSTSTRPGGIASGAAYLSRKSISTASAKAVIDRVTRLTEAWLAPGSTAARLSNPTVLLVKNDTILGRLTTWRDSERVYAVEENIGRLNDLLKLANGNGEAGNYVQTTTRTLKAGVPEAVTFQINDRPECFRLTGIAEGTWQFDVTDATSDVDLSVSLVTPDETLATGAGTLQCRISAADAQKSLYLRVTAYADTYALVCQGGTSSVFTANVRAAKLPSAGTVRIATADATIREADTNVTIEVSRTGGSYGAVSVRLSAEGLKAGSTRYDWTDATLAWADGEQGTKSATLRIHANDVYDGVETLAFSLGATADTLAGVSDETLALTITDSDKPAIAAGETTLDLWATFTPGATLKLANVKGGKIGLKVVSGSLPPGVKLSYDAATQSIVIGGAAKQGGVYTAEFVVRETIDGKSVIGESAKVTFNVKNPSAINAGVARARAVQTMAMLTKTDDGNLVAGKLQFAFSSAGQIKAKYAGTESTVYSFSGRWQSLDEETGVAEAELNGDGGATLKISLDSEGLVAAQVVAPAASSIFAKDGGAQALYGDIAPAETGVFSRYAGRYTVQMPVADADSNALNSGSVSMTLKMSDASAVSAGKMSYSALLPNGSSISGSANLERYTELDEDDFPREYARLPIFVRTNQKTFGAFLRITPNAADTWKTPSESLNLPTVAAVDGVRAYSVARGSFGAEVQFHEVYGAYFEGGHTPAGLCEIFDLNKRLEVTTGIDGFASERYGKVTRWPSVTLDAKGNSFSLVSANTPLRGKYVASSGIVKFKGTIAFGNVERTAYFIGVVMPGWVDCQCGEGFVERPFAAGTIYFTDYVRVGNAWQAVPRSAPMEMDVVE